MKRSSDIICYCKSRIFQTYVGRNVIYRVYKRTALILNCHLRLQKQCSKLKEMLQMLCQNDGKLHIIFWASHFVESGNKLPRCACNAVLPTGFGKSLIFQLLPFVYDFVNRETLTSTVIVIVISPLNGLIRDQIEKLKSFLTRHCLDVLQVNADVDTTSYDLLLKAQLIFAHPEVFVNNKVCFSHKCLFLNYWQHGMLSNSQ